MERKDIENKLTDLKNILHNISEKLEIDVKSKKINELEEISSSSDFWSNMTTAKEVLSELKSLKDIVDKYNSINDRIILTKEMLEIDLTENDMENLNIELKQLEKEIDALKTFALLDKEYDISNAYIEIHSGAGGTESNDWANMLLHMYSRYLDKNNYSYEIVSINKGEEVGIKGCTIHVKSSYAYGYLKGESGVHRLVRISPFDSGKRRHTSFASVLVTPQIEKNIEVDIKESDLKIDVYRSSGSGGQSVNTADSAVRITHIPTSCVVSCQIERSQLRNKELAMQMLKNKLYILNQKEFKDKIKELKGEVLDVNFGNATRSYVMCPYTLVKDNITGYETSNVDKVLDGEINMFIEEYLKLKK